MLISFVSSVLLGAIVGYAAALGLASIESMDRSE